MSNRVEELESQVAKLQAAVDGLTEELVETRERLRQLESDEGVEQTRTPERRGSAGDASASDGAASTADDGSTADAEPSTAADDAASTDDAAETAGPETDDDGSDSDGSDIIVA